jgi:hypothetical protein
MALTNEGRREGSPTLGEIELWPASVDVATAAAAFGISRSYGYELARGAFPAKVIQAGGRYRVVTASIIRALSDGTTAQQVRDQDT